MRFALAATLSALTLPAISEPEVLPEELPGIDVSEFIDVLSARVVHTSGMEFNGLTRGEADFTTAGVFALLGRSEFAPDWQWIPAFRYQFSSLDLDAYPFGANPAAPGLDQGLHQITLHNFVLHTPENSRWLHGAYFAAGANSDFGTFDTRHIALSAAFGSGYRFSDCFTIGLGLYGSNLLNDPFVVPAPVFFWLPTEDWLISYYGPRFVARREFGDDVRIGFEAGWNGGWWGTDAFRADSRLEVSSIRAGIYYRHRIAGEAWVEIGAGYTFANEIKLYSPGGRDRFPTALGETDAAPYVSLGFSLHRW